ncbi:MAG: 50S ribosomal protein L25/general stress protein Ctc [Bacteroidota bacterium]
MESIAINGTARAAIGKKATKAIRKAGLVPCVIYGGENNVHFTAPVNEFRHLVYTPDFKLAEITVDGNSYKCILKDLQFHPVTDDLMHLDFLLLVDGHSINLELPVRFRGTAPGTKEGGKLMQKLRRVKIKTTPEHLVDELLVDISSLELGQSIRVRDIEHNEGIEIVSAGGTPVGSVEVPRALRSATAAIEDGEEAAGDEE